MTYISPSVKMLTPVYDRETSDHIKAMEVQTIRQHDHGVIEIGVDYKAPSFPYRKRSLGEFPYDDALFEKNGLLYPVGTSGNPGEDSVGSMRFCADMPKAAKAFTDLVSQYLPNPNLRDFKVGSYFRMMEYQDGGEHFPHLDTDFHIPGVGVTKYTFLYYVNSPRNGSGKLQFIHPDHKVSEERADEGHIDWEFQSDADDHFLEIEPASGKIVIFPHDLWHGVSKFKGGDSSIYYPDDPLINSHYKRRVIRADLYLAR